MKKIDIVPGEKYGLLTVLDDAGKSDHGDRMYACICTCGCLCIKKATVIKTVLNRGQEPSCGCNRKTRKNFNKGVDISQLIL